MSEFRDQHGRFAGQPEQPEPTPEPSGPDWSSLEQRGVTPEQAAEVLDRWGALNNLDTRQQALRSIYRPDIDTWLKPVQEEQPDPYAQFAPEPEPEYEYEQQPPAMPFDPREFGNVVAQTAEERAYQRVMGELTKMAQDQQFSDSAARAVQEVGLPPVMASAIEYQARQIAQQNPHRAVGDIVGEVAKQHKMAMDQWAAQNGPAPIAGPSTPGGPAPSVMQPPRTDAEALAMSREGLDPTR